MFFDAPDSRNPGYFLFSCSVESRSFGTWTFPYLNSVNFRTALKPPDDPVREASICTK